MEFIFIILSWMILLVPGFDDSVPPTDGKIFKIETSPDIVQSIKIQSDESFDLWGFDIVLKQNSTGTLELKIPKNLPTPASFIGFWAYDERAYALANGTEINYDAVEDPCYSHYKIPIEGKTNVEIVYSVITAGTWQLYSPIEFDKDNPCYSKVFYEKPLDSPLKQIKVGIALVDIKCGDGKYPAVRYDRMRVACVSEETQNELWSRGWATMRVAMPGDNVSEALCNNYGGKWHPEYDGCRSISDLQCSLIGGKFVDDLKICENGICPDRGYEICVTENEKPESEHTSKDEMKLIYAKQKLQEIYTLNSSLGPFQIKDAIVGYGIAGDSLVVDVLTGYYESDLDLIKQKIQDIVGSEITIIFSTSEAIVPTNIESIFPYIWNSFLHRNGIEFAPKEQTYSNHDDGFYDVDKVCSPLIASNGTEFYISSTFIYKPFEITGTFIDKTKPDDCHKVWKTDTIMVEPDRTLGLWLENYHRNN